MKGRCRLMCQRLGFLALVVVAAEVLMLSLQMPTPVRTSVFDWAGTFPKTLEESTGGPTPSISSVAAAQPGGEGALVVRKPASLGPLPTTRQDLPERIGLPFSGNRGQAAQRKAGKSEPVLLQVVFAAESGMIAALQASIASVVVAAAEPRYVLVHVMVLTEDEAVVRQGLGIHGSEQQSVMLTTGARVIVHGFEEHEVAKSIPIVPLSVQKSRGRLQSPLNYVRFYLHSMLKPFVTDQSEVMIYLDTDIIVKQDLAALAQSLKASGKTIGFVRRSSDKTFPASQMLGKAKASVLEDQEWCTRRPRKWADLMFGHTYNAGVLAVNLARWRHRDVTLRVERLVRDHNRCSGSLWLGGSQPPLLLAFLERGKEELEDFIEFNKTWNYGQLGYKKDILKERLQRAAVLHWTGPGKPWKEKGLYKDQWEPYLKKWKELLPAAAAAAAMAGTESTELPPLPAEHPDSLDEKALCQLVMLSPGADKECAQEEEAWQCLKDKPAVTIRDNCSGLFEVKAVPTFCTAPARSVPGSPVACPMGQLPVSAFCEGFMALSTFFVSISDWQKKRNRKADFSKIQTFYFTSLSNGLPVTMFHDDLPEDFLQKWQSEHFSFIKVELQWFRGHRLGVNDVRYFFFREAIEAHPEWKFVFILDAFDLRIGMSPCSALRPGVLYIGKEETKVRRNKWLGDRFKDMGGKYEAWFGRQSERGNYTLNCGITGGDRELLLALLLRMQEVLTDPKLAIRKKSPNRQVNVNMAALNYIAYAEFGKRVVTGSPIHSRYWKAEKQRKDVWFIHK